MAVQAEPLRSGSGSLASALQDAVSHGGEFLSGDAPVTLDQIHNLSTTPTATGSAISLPTMSGTGSQSVAEDDGAQLSRSASVSSRSSPKAADDSPAVLPLPRASTSLRSPPARAQSSGGGFSEDKRPRKVAGGPLPRVATLAKPAPPKRESSSTGGPAPFRSGGSSARGAPSGASSPARAPTPARGRSIRSSASSSSGKALGVAPASAKGGPDAAGGERASATPAPLPVTSPASGRIPLPAPGSVSPTKRGPSGIPRMPPAGPAAGGASAARTAASRAPGVGRSELEKLMGELAAVKRELGIEAGMLEGPAPVADDPARAGQAEGQAPAADEPAGAGQAEGGHVSVVALGTASRSRSREAVEPQPRGAAPGASAEQTEASKASLEAAAARAGAVAAAELAEAPAAVEAGPPAPAAPGLAPPQPVAMKSMEVAAGERTAAAAKQGCSCSIM